MAFSASLLRKVADLGFASAGSVWVYGRTSESSTDCTATGYFVGCGAGGRGSNALGMRVGDLVAIQCATGTTLTTTGRVTWHTVLTATADQASTLAATGFAAGYNVSINAT